jgi:hypothetical protein
VQPGTVSIGLHFPTTVEQVNKPVNVTKPPIPSGISNLSLHCIVHCVPNIHLSHAKAPFFGGVSAGHLFSDSKNRLLWFWTYYKKWLMFFYISNA